MFTNYVIDHYSLHRVGGVWAVLGHYTALAVLPGAVKQAEVQRSAAQRSAAQRSAVYCSAVQCIAVQCSAVQCSAGWFCRA